MSNIFYVIIFEVCYRSFWFPFHYSFQILEAVVMLVESIKLQYGEGEDIEDPKEYLDEIGVDSSKLDKENHSRWL